MKKSVLIFFFAAINWAGKTPGTFHAEWQTVQQFLNKYHSVFSEIQLENKANLKTSLAIVSPELIRYSWLKDFIETALLEKWYVEKLYVENLGSEHCCGFNSLRWRWWQQQ